MTESGVTLDYGHRRRSDPRLLAYLVAAFGALLIAVVTGQTALAPLGAPFALFAAIGVLRKEPRRLLGAVRIAGDRVIEGGLIEGEVEVDWDGVAEVEVMLSGWRGVTPLEPDPPLSWSLTGRGPVVLPFLLRGSTWGAHSLGTLWVRARRPGGLRIAERKITETPRLRVLPTPLRLDSLFKPAEPRTVAGMHLSRARGHGSDLAELRAYRPGDRLRDLSWATSARLGEPWVREHHPERTGSVLITLDAFLTAESHTNEALARAARAAWAVASIHLRAQDRVGLLAQGRAGAWVPPQGGRRARLLLLDELLAVGAAAEEGTRRQHRGGRLIVPSDALIVGVTALRSRTFVNNLLHYRRHGHTTIALVIDTSDLLPVSDDRVDEAAKRIWMAQRAAERFSLDRNGVPTALITGSEGVAAAVSALRRRMSVMHRPSIGVAS